MILRKMTQKTMLLAFFLCCATSLAAADSVHFLQPHHDDLTPRSLATDHVSKNAANLERRPVQFTSSIDPETVIDTEISSFVSSSRQFSIPVPAQKLRAGVAIPTTAAGAIIRLNPDPSSRTNISSDTAYAIHPANLELRAADGRRLTAEEAMQSMVTPEQLREAGAPFAEGTTAFRINKRLGSGVFNLSAPILDSSEGTGFVIHVYEPESPFSLELRTAAPSYLEGQILTAQADLLGTRNPFTLNKIEGYVVSPSGKRSKVNIKDVGRASFKSVLRLTRGESSLSGLWSLHLSLDGQVNGTTLRRDVHTAFSCAPATAALTRKVHLSRSNQGIELDFGIDVAAPGRYELRGLLYATDTDGQMKPIAIAHSAAWRETGRTDLKLEYGNSLVNREGFSAPYEIRDLRLFDQGRLNLIQRQARAVIIE